MAETQDDHKLVVSLEARIRAYEKAIEKAHRETSKRMSGIEDALRKPRAEMGRLERAGTSMAAGFNKSMATASTAMSSFAKGLIAGGALAAIGSFTGAIAKARSAIAEFDQISKTARTVGLSGETYQALSFGALEASVSQDKLNTALSAFVRNAGMAVTGKGELAEKLRQLNPELLRNIVAAENQEARIRLVADALNSQTSATRRAALATSVFGEGGLELVRVLSDGAKAIDNMKARAKELGLIIPDDLLERSEKLDNQLSVLAKVIDTNLSTALVKLAPLLVSASEGAASFAIEINRLSEAVAKFQGNPDLDGFLDIFGFRLIEGGLADQFRDFVNAGLQAAKRTSEEIKTEIAAIESKISDLKALGSDDVFNGLAIDRELETLAELREELARVERATEAAARNGASALDGFANSADEALDKVSAALADQAAEVARYQAVMDQVNAAATKFGDGAFSKQTAALTEYIERSQRAVDATQAIAQAQEHLSIVANGALNEISAAVDTNSAAFAKVKGELEGLADGLINNSMAANDVVVKLQDVETSLRRLGVGESVINKLIRAFGILAGTILNAKGALDAYNTTQVGTGARTVDPKTGVGVTRFGGDGGDVDDLVRSVENGVGVSRYGFERGETATNRVRSSIGALDSHTSKYFSDLQNQIDRSVTLLGSQILSGLNAVTAAFGNGQSSATNGMSSGGILSSNGGSGIGLGTGSSNLFGSGTGGKTYTSSIGGGISLPRWGYERPLSTDDDEGTSSGSTTTIDVRVVVEPKFEGTRVSPQSLIEIQQAAAEGTNAALRAYTGR